MARDVFSHGRSELRHNDVSVSQSFVLGRPYKTTISRLCRGERPYELVEWPTQTFVLYSKCHWSAEQDISYHASMTSPAGILFTHKA